MAQPTVSDVHIDAALTDFSIAYIQDQTNFVAGRVMPTKPVQHATDKFFIFNKNDWLRNDAVKKRAPGEGAPRSGFTLSNDSYSADAWWTACPLSEMVVANADPSLRLDEAATRIVTQRMLINREVQFANKYLAAGVWGTTVTGTTDFIQWSDYASDPQRDVDTGKLTVLTNTGILPNRLVVGYKVHQALKRHPLIKDMIKYTSSESVSNAIIAKFFELDSYDFMAASYATNNEGGTAAYALVNQNNAVLFYTGGGPAIMEPTAACIFAWSGLTGINDAGIAIDQFYDINTKEDVVRGNFAFDMKVTGSDLGYYFASAT